MKTSYIPGCYKKIFFYWSEFVTNTCSLKILSLYPIFLIAMILLFILPVVCGYAQQPRIDLTQLSLEELMSIEITTVSKKAELLYDASAAIFVLTSEDIRRSGFTTLADILRMVPGLQVAQIDANKWAISSRGFNGVFANKLLVLMDGRTVYTPLYSGVFWDSQDTFLKDIARIEVIRGPGATLWGSNAVNGVINIITKKAAETQSGIINLASGNEQKFLSSFRYGGNLGKNINYRFYAKYFNRDNFVRTTGKPAADKWSIKRGGFRFDWDLARNNMVTMQGDISCGEAGQMSKIIPTLDHPYFQFFDSTSSITEYNIIGRWNHTFPAHSELQFQFYYDYSRRKTIILRGKMSTIDFNLQHRFQFRNRHDIVWGIGYRSISDQIRGSFYVSLNPVKRNLFVFNAFFQDEIKLNNDRFHLTFGSKFEQNSFTGLEVQPNVRLLYQLHKHHTFWGAISRAARTPSRAENDIWSVRDVYRDPNPNLPPAFLILKGSRDFKSEQLTAFELGHRWLAMQNISTDINLFLNNYDQLRNYEIDVDNIRYTPEQLVVPFEIANNMTAITYGGELSIDLQLHEFWQVRTAYSYLKIRARLKNTDSAEYEAMFPIHQDSTLADFARGIAGESPCNQIIFRSIINLPKSIELDIIGRYVDNVPKLNVKSHFDLDSRLAWKCTNNFEISLVGQNLLQSHHLEYIPAFADILPAEVERGVYCALSYEF